MTLAEEIIDAHATYYLLEEKLRNTILIILGANPAEPETWGLEDVGFDPVDWDGVSVELHGVTPGFHPTADQLEAIWPLGFNVVCIHYKDGTRNRYLQPPHMEG